MVSVSNSPWQAIVAAALIGTERQPFHPPGSTGQLGQVLTQLGDRPTESALLSAAATLVLYQQVGGLPEVRPLSTQAACPTHDLPRCSSRAARWLQQILQGQYPQLLTEWLARATIAGQRAPEMHLPALLDKGQQQRELRAAILPVLGQRGRWLAAQNRAWDYAINLDAELDWETGTSGARVLLLQELRSREPNQARELLQTTWSQETASDRTKFLQTLRIGLSLADEPFLETALADRRSKEVRRVAAELLASLPDSRFCQQVTAHTCRYLGMAQGKEISLTVQLPEQLDEVLLQLGFEVKQSPSMEAKFGERAWWLLQMIGATPLGIWTDRWQLAASEIIQLTQSSDWQITLLDGFALAARRQKNQEWLEALFKFWTSSQASERERQRLNFRVENLFQELSSDRRDTLLIGLLQPAQTPINDSLILWLLRYCSQQWSVDLAEVVLDRLEQHVNLATQFSNPDWELRVALKEFARFIPISLTATVMHWRTQLPQDSSWRQSVDELLELLQFRQEIAQAFESKDGG